MQIRSKVYHTENNATTFYCHEIVARNTIRPLSNYIHSNIFTTTHHIRDTFMLQIENNERFAFACW